MTGPSETLNGTCVEVTAIAKKVKNTSILSDITFSVKTGECFGLLGENGSGKTMLLRIMTGLVTPTSGSVRVFGESPHENPTMALRQIGAMIGIPAFYGHLSAYHNLRLLTDGNDIPKRELIMEVLEMLGLEDDADKKVGVFSRGMLQRLGIALSILDNHPLYILDEPTQGVDSVWEVRLVDILKSEMKKGKTVLITSHNFDFIMELCTQVLILDSGKAVYHGPLKDIAEFPYYFILKCTPMEKGLDVIRKLPFVHKAIVKESELRLTLDSKHSSGLVKTLIDSGCDVHEYSQRHYSISDLVSIRQNRAEN